MLSRILFTIYCALSGFKRNIQQLSGDYELLEGESLIEVRTDPRQVEDYLHRIRPLLQGGLDQHDIDFIAETALTLRPQQTQRLEFNVFYDGQLAGLTVLLYAEERSRLSLYLLTEEELARSIRISLDICDRASRRLH